MKNFRYLFASLFLSMAAHTAETRTKVIDFESNLVEGINRKPYDSLSQISDAKKRREKAHLYRKRTGFSSDTRETLSEARFAQ